MSIPLTNLDILRYVERVNLPNFRGVFMRDTLPLEPNQKECGIVNLNTSHEPGSHWVCYFKNGKDRIYRVVQKNIRSEKFYKKAINLLNFANFVINPCNIYVRFISNQLNPYLPASIETILNSI